MHLIYSYPEHTAWGSFFYALSHQGFIHQGWSAPMSEVFVYLRSK
ncbi:hypothetical protein HMPREF9134_00206 [Porphyromonas catoniae F0037]|uniref:Uncharacterized protein n=1 Tax=Porphyromonas catoniae F0037 TaxID=1127696 RepID=L1NID3_9PORP|nr:hypothetical protein HMPREF9134_00206 [Porphyromonas catoniae F0037]